MKDMSRFYKKILISSIIIILCMAFLIVFLTMKQ